MARSFNGSTDQISAGNVLNLTPPVTVSMWVYLTSIGASENTFMKITNTGIHFYGLNINAAGGWQLQGDLNSLGAAGTLSAGQWYHIVGVATGGGTDVVYLNGGSNATGTWNWTAVGAFAFVIGADTVNARFFTGKIADFAVWNTNLASSDVTKLFAGVRPITVNSANLQGWWPLDGYASPEPDLSGNSNNGTLTGTSGVRGPPALWRLSA